MKKILLSLFLVACYFVGMSQCNPPRDLQGTTTKNKVVLSWTAPAQQGDEEILTWSDTELSSGIGLGSTTEFNCLHKFLASELSSYVGWQVTKIAFTPYQSGTFTIKVWKGTGANPSGNPMLTQSVPSPSLQSMNVIVLTSPFTIEANQTYWFGYGAAAPSSAEYPAGTDAGPAVSGKGDVVGWGSSWTTLTANNLDYNFIIQTTVVNAKGEEKVLAIDKGGAVASYNVYRNGGLIGNTVAETYTDTGLEMETTYNYCVEAVWTDGCISQQICGDFTTQGMTCTPPETVTVSTTLDAMNISWTAPYIPSSEEWLTWAGDPDFNNGIGTGSATTFSVAHRFQVAEIAPYGGYELTKVRFVPCESACTYTVRVWVGGTSGTNPGTMVVNQEVPAEEITLNAWNEITLDAPVSITGAEELWFGYFANTTTGYPAGVDNGPAVTGKGDLMHFGGSWTTLYDLGLDYNWAIQGFVQNDGKGVYLNSPVTVNDETKGNIEDLRAAHTRILRAVPVKGNRDAVASYNIYVDGDLMGSVNGNTFEYSVDGFEDGKYDVCVTALYDNGCESLPTCVNTEIVTSCWPANNLEATILAKKNVKLTWSEPIDPFAPTTWISWSSDQAGGNSIGTGSASDFCCAHRFEPEDIAEYDGMNIVAINFVPGVAGDQCDYYIRVWVGGNETGPDELVYDQAVDGSTIVTKAWNLVYLDTPVTIDAREELWIGYRCNTTTGHPGGCDDGPRVDYKGNMMYFGGEWMTMWDAGGGSQANLDYNWSIQGGLADAQGKIHFMSPIADNMNASPVNVTFSAAPMQESGVKMPAFDHYLVYRDGEVIKNTKSKTFTDTNRPNGTYLYEVTAVYVNECESDPISVTVIVDENGIGDDINSDIKVYPNPANNVLTVNGIEMTSIVIYNSLGQTVATIPVNGNTVNIETSSYPAGMYFIDVNTADNVVVRTKVVIAR
ncbi:MAG: T9SS type A sorting domain-containing protein [Bacteroidales bacterium]|nr:T9SS type A sorting domain-containing protein [Bacteroidales bacterium]